MAALPVLSVGLGHAALAETRSPQDRLHAALADLPLPCTPGRLDVVRFEKNETQMSAVVRLTWQPGRRQQVFRAQSASTDQSIEALINDVRAWVAQLA